MTGAAPAGWVSRLKRLGHSLRLRIVALFLLLAVAIVAVGAGGMQRAIGGGWRGLIRPLVADYVDRLVADIGSPPDVARAQALVERLPLYLRIEGPQVNWESSALQPLPSPFRRPSSEAASEYHRRMAEHHRRMAGRDGAVEGSQEGPEDEGRVPWRRNGMGSGMRPGETVEPVDPQEGPAGAEERGWLLLSRATADGHRIHVGLARVPWRERPRFIGWLTLALLLGLTAVAYAVVSRWLRPLDDIARGAQRFGGGDFAAPIPQRRRDELGELAGHINTMASQLLGMLDAKRALLLAISHELRSPLTRARLNAELVDDGPAREALLRDLGEMRDLISDLLESERLSAGHRALQLESTDLAALVRAAAEEVQEAIALTAEAGGPSPLPLHFELDGSIGPVAVDAARWRVLVRNLVGNALRHGRPADAWAVEAWPVEVQLSRSGTELRLRVRDHGPGVGLEQLPRLTEAFYRPDSDRGRRSGGVGLGLTLCRQIAEAHGGRLTLSLAEPGLAAEVRWTPRSPD
jgi:signal transduction histidine kinase